MLVIGCYMSQYIILYTVRFQRVLMKAISHIRFRLLWIPDDVFRIIATNQRVVAAQRQQRGLVAVTIRGSVLFYSSAIWRPNFHSVKTEFRYLYGVDSIELRTLFYLWKMCRDHHWHWKNTKSKSEGRRCQFCWYLTCILTIRLRDFFDHQELER